MEHVHRSQQLSSAKVIVFYFVTWSTALSVLFLVTHLEHENTTRGTEITNDTLLLQSNTSKHCDHKLFRAYYRNNGYFPSGGDWTWVGNSKAFPFYRPTVCTFMDHRIPPQNLSMCLNKDGIKSIAVVGDSQGLRYFLALENIIHDALKYQQMQAKKKLHLYQVEEMSYMDIWSCHEKCPNIVDVYKEETGTEMLRLQYVHMRLTNQLVGYIRPKKGETKHLFQIYFNGTSAPDLLLLVTPISHFKWKTSLEQFPKEAKSLLQATRTFLPNETFIQWIPGFAEFEENKQKDWQYRKFHGYLGTDKIDRLNRLLFDIIRTDISADDSHHYGTFDFLSASLTRGDWSYDGVHMAPVWYQAMVSYILEMLCDE